MSNTNTNTTNTTEAAAAELKRWHNLPSGKEIVTSIADFVSAQKKGDYAQARLCIGMYHGFSEVVSDANGVTSYLVNKADAIKYMKGAGKGADEKAREEAKKFAEHIVDEYASYFSSEYNRCLKQIAAFEGEKLKDSDKELKLECQKTVKRIRVLIGRALSVAAFIADQKELPKFVNLQKNGEIRQVWENDALNASFDSLERAMRDEHPKSKGADTRDEEHAEEKADDGTTLLGSVEFVCKHVTRVNFNAQPAPVREQLEGLFVELLAVFGSRQTELQAKHAKKKSA
jgi:hypothetical protein